jgi:hypothetical protein
MDIPEWFDDAIRATQENYRRINTSKRVCRLCGHNIMVATDRISKSDDHTLRNPYHTETYPFCACAQSLALKRGARAGDVGRHGDDVSREDRQTGDQ